MKTVRKLFILLYFLLSLSAKGISQSVDFGKSYINVSKGLNGGTLETGDTLEIRASFVVRSGTYDSCGYSDAIPAGTVYIPGTIRVLTNEGKIYKQFTDAAGDDEGWITGSNIFIHLGYNQSSNPARWYRRGRVVNTHYPSFYGSTCIMIASFRVRITAATGAVVSTGGGSITYKNGAAAIQTYTFPANQIAVYKNYGICPNTVGTNSLGTEFNGTFGSGKPRNRGTSANVPPSYTYNIFTANSPQDYYYGIANNTSTDNAYTTSNAWAKPDNSATTHRVFTVWDIIGDHTGAASLTAGNTAADTVTKPNSGYMLVINASYRIDSAFQQTISGLCPNTYYEISCWMRNICSRCGCDSLGRGASSAGYLPTAANDSSGVYPNLTFEVDGIDYYTTGNLLYTGKWIKKGFTFLTGPSQTSFTLKFFNNAPGGGGNDWALDDISVATCSPDLVFTPSNNPDICAGYTAFLGVNVKSFFNNYVYYKWQKSTDNGATWTETGVTGIGNPSWNGTAWQYHVDYPPFVVSTADDGTQFRVMVATTAANLSNSSCLYMGSASVITLNIIACGNPLTTDFISFHAQKKGTQSNLVWTTNSEEEPIQYKVERSTDGLTYETIAVLPGTALSFDMNQYAYTDAGLPHASAFYRIRMTNGSGKEKMSKIIKLNEISATTEIIKLQNPFSGPLTLTVSTEKTSPLWIQLLDNTGRSVYQKKCVLGEGVEKLTLENTQGLAKGIYTLQLQVNNEMITKQVVKN